MVRDSVEPLVGIIRHEQRKIAGVGAARPAGLLGRSSTEQATVDSSRGEAKARLSTLIGSKWGVRPPGSRSTAPLAPGSQKKHFAVQALRVAAALPCSHEDFARRSCSVCGTVRAFVSSDVPFPDPDGVLENMWRRFGAVGRRQARRRRRRTRRGHTRCSSEMGR